MIAIAQKKASRVFVENQMVKVLESKGRKAVKSYEIFPAQFDQEGDARKQQTADLMRNAGCDGVITVAFPDVKTESRHTPMMDYVSRPPYKYRYCDSYFSYYQCRHRDVQQPGKLATEKMYFLETNFYDLKTENRLQTIPSEAFEPVDLNSWFRGYSKLSIKQLTKEKTFNKMKR